MGMDEALAAIYDETSATEEQKRGQRSAGLGPSAPSLAKWLRDIRSYFVASEIELLRAFG